MPSKYIFDTGFLILALIEDLPEKWKLPWREVKLGRKLCYIIEPVLMETAYQLMRRGFNKDKTKDIIIKLKSLKSVKIVKLDDNDAMESAILHTRFKLSFVDCILLSIAKRYRLKIFTTDAPLKNIARKLNVDVNHLPIH